MYFDFSKAFDKVALNRLLLKLEAYGIKGKIHAWIREWLSGRSQCTVLNGEFSNWINVLSGVPQGSVLGLLLFIVFIDDIDSCANFISIIRKFADDTKVGNCIQSDSDIESLQQCINDMFNWSDIWDMQFNIQKCKVMHLGQHNPCNAYTMNSTPLSAVNRIE